MPPGPADMRPTPLRFRWLPALLLVACTWAARATPANRAALEKHFDRFLTPSLARCTTCHLPGTNSLPESLEEFPHNPFGNRLRELAGARDADGRRPDLATRLARAATEDADADGVANQVEILLGTNPGDPSDRPSDDLLAGAPAREEAFAAFLKGYRWRPFEPVERPPVPVRSSDPPGNPIDAFLAAAREARGLVARPEAAPEVLLRRVSLDLIGLQPTPAEQEAFRADTAPGAYERVVDRLLEDPRHGERWARHWMDVWRYSDWAGWTDGGQVRDSQRHIWRWRDWIVEALHADTPYDRMLTAMLAADEVAPGDPETLRATGFLVRNYKMLSREQWLEDTVKHTAQAFFGMTVGCAKCHDHMADPITQREYYALRAVFEPHQVRTDRVPGEPDTARDGLPRVYDATNAPTWFLVRGDERHPLTNEVIRPGVPALLGGGLDVRPVDIPWAARHPDRRPFVMRDLIDAARREVAARREALDRLAADDPAAGAARGEALLELDLALKREAALRAEAALEAAAGEGPAPAGLATNLVLVQRTVAVAEAALAEHRARVAHDGAAEEKKAAAATALAEARSRHATALADLARPLDAAFTPRPAAEYPPTSTGRRSAFARWLTDPRHPLTARVAVNHVWLRHFGRGLVPTPADFGANGRPPSHPELLDWLAAEFVEPTVPAAGARPGPWSFRHLHRLIVTSAAYRMASTPDTRDLAADPDNVFLWRMNSRRLEAEAVRDNLLWASGSLDLARGGPDIDHREVLTSPRRSLYLRHAAEKQAEFLQIFDGPAVTECYQRHTSVLPQQALALGNSEMALREAGRLAARLAEAAGGDWDRLVDLAFRRVLGRSATADELRVAAGFPATIPASTGAARRSLEREAAHLVLVLFNHHDFVTVR